MATREELQTSLTAQSAQIAQLGQVVTDEAAQVTVKVNELQAMILQLQTDATVPVDFTDILAQVTASTDRLNALGASISGIYSEPVVEVPPAA